MSTEIKFFKTSQCLKNYEMGNLQASELFRVTYEPNRGAETDPNPEKHFKMTKILLQIFLSFQNSLCNANI